MQDLRITATMVLAQISEVGLNTMFKSATTNGMSNFVYIVYSNVLALCVLLPATFLYHRKKAAPPITISIICRLLLVGLLSWSVQTLMYTGIKYSSPTLSSAMVDLVPAFTFILAVISRMEILNLKLQSSQAKVIGTVVSITGALIVTFYNGQPLTSGSMPHKVLDLTSLTQKSDWLLGGFLLAIGSFGLSVLFIVQTWVIKDYPSELMVTSICCTFAVIPSAIIALIAEPNPQAWLLRPDMELLAIIYSAFFVVSLRSIVYTWACRKKGPVYVAMFNPLGMVIAIGMGIIFLGDTLYLGSMIGAAIIGIGFYVVLWGQAAQEGEMVNEKNHRRSIVASASTVPLLQNKSIDV